ncbi:DUF5661 family protein [Marimonas arenosa]|uniref:Uncharacterized protein n=1 Tax=Marimonas arenosa TaxID=1795305 RepID=A0AAE4B6T4_9RHOB|nr:DUF5661 family protein [Marimonas arenosa]MDQ2091684.1 hypothetical protein [Marimonas arenosa]
MPKYAYVTDKDVSDACKELGLSDWSGRKDIEVTEAEARILRDVVGGETLDLPLDEFRQALEVELEHGLAFDDANVTCNHPVLTGLIVLAHLKEGTDYYRRLTVMELEMERDAAEKAGNTERAAKKAKALEAARAALDTG